MSRPLTPTSFMEAATSILSEEGLGGLSIVALCTRLKVSRGSFYHHFASLSDFEDRYIDYFENQVSAARFDAIDAERSLRDRSEIAIRLAEQADFRAERAIRMWGLSDGRVASMLQRIDDRFVTVIARSIRSAGGNDDVARDYAGLALAVWIGLGMQPVPPASELLRRMYHELEWAANARATEDAAHKMLPPE